MAFVGYNQMIVPTFLTPPAPFRRILQGTPKLVQHPNPKNSEQVRAGKVKPAMCKTKTNGPGALTNDSIPLYGK